MAVYSSPSQRSQPFATISRGNRGRFVSRSPITDKKARRSFSQRKHVHLKKARLTKLFEKFLSMIVVRGSEKDYLSSSRDKGALVRLLEGTVKPEHCLSPNLRYTVLKRYCLRNTNAIQNAGDVCKLTAKGYKGWRLVSAQFESEMTMVRDWINYLAGNGILLGDDTSAACSMADSLLRDSACPEVQCNTTIQDDNSESSRLRTADICRNCSQQIQSGLVSTETNESNAQQLITSSINQVGSIEIAPFENTNRGSITPPPEESIDDFLDLINTCDATFSPESTSMLDRADMLYESASNDAVYMMVHLALDTRRWAFGIFWSLCVTNFRRLKLKPTTLMKSAMMYAAWKRHGIVEETEHLEREKTLRETAQLLDVTRISISTEEKPLPLYRNLKQKFAVRGDQPCTENQC